MERCPLCPSHKLPEGQRKRPVAGDLDNYGGVLFVGEGPGREENNRNRVFVGRTGAEFDVTYLMRAGLTRLVVNVTNACKCHWADSGDAPPLDLVASCSAFHLSEELDAVQPSMVVLMGGVANSLMDWDVEHEHGILHEGCTLYNWKGPIYSTFHPALGMHKTSKMQMLIDDFRDLKGYLRGTKKPLVSLCDNPVYEKLVFPSEIQRVMGGRKLDPIAVDTESVKRWKGFDSTIRYTPDRLTFCIEPPHAFMVMRKDSTAMAEFAVWFRKCREVYMQNMPHDDWALSEMGVYTPWDRVFDTMSAAYCDGRIAKGLKSMGLHLAGIRMTSFDEIVVPYGYERALEYMAEANLREWDKPEQSWTGLYVERNCVDCKGKGYLAVGRGKERRQYPCDCNNGKAMVKEMTKHQALGQAIKRIFTDLRKGNVKVWERWEAWTEKLHLLPAIQQLIESRGPIPLPSIDYVPEAEAMVYACGDALVTRIIGPILKKRLALIRRSVGSDGKRRRR